MGRLIEESRTTTPMSKEEIVENLKTMVFGVQAFERFNAKERETLDKAWNIIDQYENRLKADMVAMLEELKKEIVETTIPTATILGEIFWNMGADAMKEEIGTRIQEKIDKLKGNVDDTSSIMPDWHIKELDDERCSVYNKNYEYLGTFDTKSDAYNYIVSNFSHKRGIIHVHGIDGAVIEELKFPFKKF